MISNSNLSICFYHTEYMVLQTAAHRADSSVLLVTSPLTDCISSQDCTVIQ